METLSTAQDDSSGANPSSVKSDDSSPCPDRGAGSPPPNCAICLGTCKNKSFTDSCLHQFCFACLLTWSKVKAECPLCKQAFRSIIHNVRSNHQYEEYMVVQRHTEETTSRIDIDRVSTSPHHRFRYRTTFTLPRRETLAIQQLLRHYPFMADVFPTPAARPPVARRRRSPASFRRTVYRHNLWARPLPDFTGRYRDCTPDFYRYNETQMIRLMPWLNRELHYLLNENVGHIAYVMSRILDLLPQHHINSPEFRESMHRYFGDRTDHFLHELYCFASTPYDMTGYDRNVQYTTDSRISTMVNEVISSTDSEASVDSDIVMVSSSEPAEPPAGPSRFPAPTYPQSFIAPTNNNTVIPIETISQSDTDDDSSEVMVVGYIKPPEDRTPEIVDLLGSDSDVIVQDNPQPEPTQETIFETLEIRSVPTVKLTLKRHSARETGAAAGSESDSDDSSYRPPPPRRRRPRCDAPTTTSDSERTTPGASPAPSSSSGTDRSPSTTATSSDEDTDYSNKLVNKKSKKKIKSISTSTSSRDRRRNKKRSSHHKEKKNSPTSEKDKRSKQKSYSGKGVKSSNKVLCTERSSASAEPIQLAIDQPSTSGTSLRDRRKAKKERKRRRRDSRKFRRLRSVVKVMYSSKNDESSSSTLFSNMSSTAATTTSRSDVESTSGTPDSRARPTKPEPSTSSSIVMNQHIFSESSSDSDDNLPLNLTLQKLSPLSSP